MYYVLFSVREKGELACSRFRTSGESAIWEKECEKKRRAGERQGLFPPDRLLFSRSGASHFRVPLLTVVLPLLSESLERAKGEQTQEKNIPWTLLGVLGTLYVFHVRQKFLSFNFSED